MRARTAGGRRSRASTRCGRSPERPSPPRCAGRSSPRTSPRGTSAWPRRSGESSATAISSGPCSPSRKRSPRLGARSPAFAARPDVWITAPRRWSRLHCASALRQAACMHQLQAHRPKGGRHAAETLALALRPLFRRGAPAARVGPGEPRLVALDRRPREPTSAPGRRPRGPGRCPQNAPLAAVAGPRAQGRALRHPPPRSPLPGLAAVRGKGDGRARDRLSDRGADPSRSPGG